MKYLPSNGLSDSTSELIDHNDDVTGGNGSVRAGENDELKIKGKRTKEMAVG